MKSGMKVVMKVQGQGSRVFHPTRDEAGTVSL